jgi:hypothetical protein
MSEQSPSPDPGNVWRNQPRENLEVNLQKFINRRTQDIYSRTRTEVLTSLFAALFFVAVISYRFPIAQERLLQIFAALVVLWIAITLYRFRARIWRPVPLDTFAVSGLDYYRNELELRREHLRSIWLWHGPLLLAIGVFVLFILGKAFPSPALLQRTVPFFALLAVWIVVGVLRRRRMVRDIEREIDEIEQAR